MVIERIARIGLWVMIAIYLEFWRSGLDWMFCLVMILLAWLCLAHAPEGNS